MNLADEFGNILAEFIVYCIYTIAHVPSELYIL